MKHTLQTLLILFALIASTAITPASARLLTDLSPDEPVRIECQYYGTGAVVTGQLHGTTALLYYLAGNTTADDGWWYVRAEGDGYVMTNAATGQYMTYSNERIEGVQKGITLTAQSRGAESQWLFEAQSDGTYRIHSVAAPDQYFNQRVDGTYLLGTYAAEEGQNERFTLYDRQGRTVTPQASTRPVGLNQLLDKLSVSMGDQVARTAVYDAWQEAYLLPIDTLLRHGGELSLTFSPTYAAGTVSQGYNLTLAGQSPDEATHTVTLSHPTCATPYVLQLKDADGQVVASGALQLTYLPVVDLRVDDERYLNGTTYTSGSLRVVDAMDETPDTMLTAAFRYRGVTAQRMDKKALAVKLYDASGSSLDHSFFGLRDDNNWILDAMAVDAACMRNRVSFDLWNDFAAPPYYKADEKKALTGTRGRFVEVVFNGRYLGLYCMTEKLDRKQLKLKKYKEAKGSKPAEIHGLLYKTGDWSYEVLMGHEVDQDYYPGHAPAGYSNRLGQEEWRGYEQSYPDAMDEAVDWEPMWSGVNFVATSSQTDFDTSVKERFDYATLRDYYLFI